MSTGKDDRRARRRKEILSMAADLFLERGYANTSMDAIQRHVGGSKRTLYSHFETKEALLRAIVEELTSRLFAALAHDFPPDAPPRAALTRFGQQYVRTMLAPDAVRLFRLVVSQSHHHPELMQTFLKSGPLRALEELKAQLLRWQGSGVLDIPDPESAGGMFIGMLRGLLIVRAIAINRIPSGEEIDQHVERAVAVLLDGLKPR